MLLFYTTDISRMMFRTPKVKFNAPVTNLTLMLKRNALRRALASFYSTVRDDSAVHKVIISKSHDIVDNLSLEDWLYENAPLKPADTILLMWRSNPCVVIGKYQSPWLECNIPFLQENSIQLGNFDSSL